MVPARQLGLVHSRDRSPPAGHSQSQDDDRGDVRPPPRPARRMLERRSVPRPPALRHRLRHPSRSMLSILLQQEQRLLPGDGERGPSGRPVHRGIRPQGEVGADQGEDDTCTAHHEEGQPRGIHRDRRVMAGEGDHGLMRERRRTVLCHRQQEATKKSRGNECQTADRRHDRQQLRARGRPAAGQRLHRPGDHVLLSRQTAFGTPLVTHLIPPSRPALTAKQDYGANAGRTKRIPRNRSHEPGATRSPYGAKIANTNHNAPINM
ncbi:hypothetical protein HNP00_004642 [Arthrobacter sp. AZCC_0090]|nr:hypothetical protein [Arthrobacter sp. AZCC_0090]